MKLLNNNWDKVLAKEFEQEYFKNLIEKVDIEYTKYCVYPSKDRIFSSMECTDFDDVKVVIIGQDPYFRAGQAHGLCFSVLPATKIPPSLKNIYKEIVSDIGGFIPDNGYLLPWTKQGVLLLNAVLTVRDGCPNSHKIFGWETFTDSVIKALNKSNHKIVFLLWETMQNKKIN